VALEPGNYPRPGLLPVDPGPGRWTVAGRCGSGGRVPRRCGQHGGQGDQARVKLLLRPRIDSEHAVRSTAALVARTSLPTISLSPSSKVLVEALVAG